MHRSTMCVIAMLLGSPASAAGGPPSVAAAPIAATEVGPLRVLLGSLGDGMETTAQEQVAWRELKRGPLSVAEYAELVHHTLSVLEGDAPLTLKLRLGHLALFSCRSLPEASARGVPTSWRVVYLPDRPIGLSALRQMVAADPRVTTRLIGLLAVGPPAQRVSVVAALGEIGQGAATALPALQDLARGSDSKQLSEAAVHVIAAVSPTPATHLVELYPDLSFELREASLHLTAGLTDPAAEEIVWLAAAERWPRLRSLAAQRLAGLSADPANLRALCGLLSDPDPAVQTAAAEGVAALESADAGPMMARYVDVLAAEPDERTALAIVERLRGMTAGEPACGTELRELVSHHPSGGRYLRQMLYPRP